MLLTQYCSGDQIENNEKGGAFSTYGREQRCIQVLVGKPEGKRPLGRPRRIWQDNIKKDFREAGFSWDVESLRMVTGVPLYETM